MEEIRMALDTGTFASALAAFDARYRPVSARVQSGNTETLQTGAGDGRQ